MWWPEGVKADKEEERQRRRDDGEGRGDTEILRETRGRRVS